MQIVKLTLLISFLSGILLLIANFAPAFPKITFTPQETIVNHFKTDPIPQKPASGSFVKRQGERLILDGMDYAIVGVNDYALAYQSNDVIDRTFVALQKAGVTTVRFWLFGDGHPDGFQPEPGQINEARFKQADYVIYSAQKYNIKLIPVLVNNWTDYGGKAQYLKWSGKSASTTDPSFYTDPNIRSLFENYLSYVFSRKNTYTNVQYTDDPTILGWDIMNEPRSTSNIEMNNWLASIALDMKAHDPNHLVFVGTERATGAVTDEGKSTELCEHNAIDVCSIHLYLFNEQKPLFASYQEVTRYLQMQKVYANKINKPVFLEEFGIATDTKPFGQSQLSVMKQLLGVAQKDGYAGVLIWDWANESKSPFTFSPEVEKGYSLTDLQQLFR